MNERTARHPGHRDLLPYSHPLRGIGGLYALMIE
jgi:hypothetical protein